MSARGASLLGTPIAIDVVATGRGWPRYGTLSQKIVHATHTPITVRPIRRSAGRAATRVIAESDPTRAYPGTHPMRSDLAPHQLLLVTMVAAVGIMCLGPHGPPVPRVFHRNPKGLRRTVTDPRSRLPLPGLSSRTRAEPLRR